MTHAHVLVDAGRHEQPAANSDVEPPKDQGAILTHPELVAPGDADDAEDPPRPQPGLDVVAEFRDRVVADLAATEEKQRGPRIVSRQHASASRNAGAIAAWLARDSDAAVELARRRDRLDDLTHDGAGARRADAEVWTAILGSTLMGSRGRGLLRVARLALRSSLRRSNTER